VLYNLGADRPASVPERPLEVDMPQVGAVAAATKSAPKQRDQTHDETKPEPLYNVVLIDDDDHTYEYVVRMLCTLFGHSVEVAFAMACEVDAQGRVIVDTTHRERAELKRDQIRSFGADPLLRGSSGSMHSVVEPMTG
jgi:ATP-dependent Clp protease adaptor protein ClpS